MPSLEESPLTVLKFDVLNVDIPNSFSWVRYIQSSDKNQRIERAVMLPARCCDIRKKRSLGFADL